MIRPANACESLSSFAASSAKTRSQTVRLPVAPLCPIKIAFSSAAHFLYSLDFDSLSMLCVSFIANAMLTRLLITTW